MTIQNQQSKITYTADGVATTYTIPFYFLNNEIAVYYNTSDKKLMINQDYIIIKNNSQQGGEIKFSTPPQKDTRITILRDVPLTQLTTFIEGENFPAKDYEVSLDRIIMALQMLKEALERAITFTPNQQINNQEFQNLINKIAQNYELIEQIPSLSSSITQIYKELITKFEEQQKQGPLSIPTSNIHLTNLHKDYPYSLDIMLEKAKSTHTPIVIFSLLDATSSNFAPSAESYDGYVRIYMKTIPSTETIEIPIILLQ